MEKLEIIEKDIKDLENAYENIEELLNNLSDIPEIDKDEYSEIDRIKDKIDDLIDNKKRELDQEREKQFFEDNEEEWKRDQNLANKDYERSRL